MMNSNDDFRFSVPPGTVLKGVKGQYKVVNIICISDRSVTLSCTDASNSSWRLKVYNGNSSVTEELQRSLLGARVNGVLCPSDIGDYSGLRFAVFRKIDGATSADKYPVSIQVLTNKVVPQMAQVLEQYHRSRILLRDICPEHMLYMPNEEKISYCGFSNVVALSGKATTTKAPGYGQHFSFIAPEVEQYGYSSCSDYFSMGVTLLSILRGYNPIEKVDQRAFYEQLNKGAVPGIDVQHLRNTSPSLYSAEDKILYLILGLLISDPSKRWGLGEIRCWCNNQMIPLVQNGPRIAYQFNKPFIIGTKKYWNARMLAKGIAAQKQAWSDGFVNNIPEFCTKQMLGCSSELARYKSDSSLSVSGKIFRYIYVLDPSINGFWWNGFQYVDTNELINAVKRGGLELTELSNILRDSALSFFETRRQSLGIQGINIQEIEALERTEAAEPGKGAQRCLMLFSGNNHNRLFTVEGKKYFTLSDLIIGYRANGKKLRELSASILVDNSFQAWLWAKGIETAGSEAARIASSNPEQSFYLLLSICESEIKDENVKRKARELYLRWGEYSPIVWLAQNVKYYQCTSDSHRSLYDTFLQAKFNLNTTLEGLSRFSNELVSDYQLFVSRTLTNPFLLENDNIENHSIGYYPLYEAGYFCCKWEGFEVCPAFLKSIGEWIDAKAIKDWLEKTSKEEEEILRKKNNSIPVLSSTRIENETDYLAVCNRNFWSAVFMIVFAVVLLALSFRGHLTVGPLAFVAAILFPIFSLNWYYRRKAHAEIWVRNKAELGNRRSVIDSQINNLKFRKNAIEQDIISGKPAKSIVADKIVSTSYSDIEDPQLLNLSNGQKIMAYVSTYGFVMLATSAIGNIYQSFLLASLYALVYGIAIPFLIQRRKFVNSCFGWCIITTSVALASIAGGIAFGTSFFVTMNWVSLVIVAGFAIGCLIVLFI